MFTTYDLKQFGKFLKKLRKLNRFTQSNVKEFTGIHEDTLRKIESGLVIVKFETLEQLSSMYKIDLFEALVSFKSEDTLSFYYKSLENYILDNDVAKIEALSKQLNKLDPALYALVAPKEVTQLKTFCHSLIAYYTGNAVEKHTAKNNLIHSLKETIPTFQLHHYSNYNYNFLELRVLLLIALFEAKDKHYKFSTELLLFILKHNEPLTHYNQISIKFQLSTLFNISYNYHCMNEHLQALRYSETGIKFGIEHDHLHKLYPFYYRKAIAEYHLDNKNYHHSLEKTYALMSLLEKDSLLDLYKQITFEKYQISL